RRPIDPPPIIQIRLKNASAQDIHDFHQNPFFFMCANLAHPSNDNEVYTPNHNALSGQTVSSMYKLKDIDNHDGAFFIFGDLSVKVEGHFRLKFTLFEITTTGAVSLKSIFSDVFTVYSSRTYPGMLDSTFLSRSFSDQGARIRIRKEQRAQPPGSRKRKVSDADEPLDTNDARVSPSAPGPLVVERPSSPSSPQTPTAGHPQSGSPWCWQPSPMTMTAQPSTPYARRESINSHSSGTESTDSPSVTPVSPPQQPYDQPQRIIPTAYFSKVMPSPPSQQLKPVDFFLPPPRCLEDDDATLIRLPPLSHVLPAQKRQKNMGEVDAAVAMVQLHQSILW
ncbi:hypothetical protein EC973_002840, partial [Apophysomyces ossiformis]